MTTKGMTRDVAQAPFYAHWHNWCRFPSGLRSEGCYKTRDEAVADMKASRVMSNDGFPRYVAWCTNTTQWSESGACNPR